jgi:hypothetical protein
MRYLIAILALAGIFDSCLALRIHNQILRRLRRVR